MTEELWNLNRHEFSAIYDLCNHATEADRLELRAIARKIGPVGCAVLARAIEGLVQAECEAIVRKCSEEQPRRKKR